MDLYAWCRGKLEKTPGKLLLGGFLAGAYIGFAGQMFTLVTLPQGLPWGFRQLLGGLVFSVGLIMVVLGRVDLFTGNCLLVAYCLKERESFLKILANWALVYGGNFLGAFSLALLYTASGLSEAQGGIIAERIVAIAQGKVAITFSQGFFRGVLCNWLVDLAVLFALSAENQVAAILAIPGPIITFATLGYEHSVANIVLPPGRSWNDLGKGTP